MERTLSPPLIAGSSTASELSSAERLRAAYAEKETMRPAYLSPSLRGLFEVTLNCEILLFSSDETETSLMRRKKRLQWYNEIYSGLRCTHNVSDLLLYWVTGIINYEFREMERCMVGINDEDMKMSEEQQQLLWSGAAREVGAPEEVRSLEAIQHAMELRNVIRRLPALVSFFFAWDVNWGDLSRFEELLKTAIESGFSRECGLSLLERLLTWTLRWRRGFHWGNVRSCNKLAPQPQQRLQVAQSDICELIVLFDGDSRMTEERIALRAIRSVDEGCKKYFSRQMLLSLLGSEEADARERLFFFEERWPRYKKAELDMLLEISSVEEEMVQVVLSNMVLLWEYKGASGEETISDESSFDGHNSYLLQLLLLTLRPIFDDLFGVSRSEGQDEVVHATGSGAARVLAPKNDSADEEDDSMSSLLKIVDAVMAVGSSSCRSAHHLESISVEPLPMRSTVSANQDIGSLIMATACKQLLQQRVPLSIGSFVSCKEESQGPFQQLVRYLIRTEKVYNWLCGIKSLKVCLLGKQGSDNEARGCFYSIVEEALADLQGSQRSVHAVVGKLLHGAHEYLWAPSETLPSAKNRIVGSNDDLRAALRLVQGLSGRTHLFEFYKENLSTRLLSILNLRSGDDEATTVDDSTLERLQLEESACSFLLELFPLDCGTVRQMRQMCDDVKTASETSEIFRQVQKLSTSMAENTPNLTANVISLYNWPTYPKLESVPRQLKSVMDEFVYFYSQRHPTRQVTWIRTTFERVTFDVTYPRGTTLITGSLDHYKVFACLSEVSAAGAGATWRHLAEQVGWRPATLQQELRRPVFDGLLLLPPEAEGDVTDAANALPLETVRLNPDFSFPQSKLDLTVKPATVQLPSAHNRADGQVTKGFRESRLGSIQAAVVRKLKVIKQSSYKHLLQFVRESLQQHFQVLDVEFKEVLGTLINKEFIVRDETRREWFAYKE